MLYKIENLIKINMVKKNYIATCFLFSFIFAFLFYINLIVSSLYKGLEGLPPTINFFIKIYEQVKVYKPSIIILGFTLLFLPMNFVLLLLCQILFKQRSIKYYKFILVFLSCLFVFTTLGLLKITLNIASYPRS